MSLKLPHYLREFKNIPKDWSIRKLGEICNKITDGTHKTPKYVEKGIPFLSTINIKPFYGDFDFSSYRKNISKEEHKELIKRCNPKKGDILISKCGTIGRSQLIKVDYEFSIFVGLALLKMKKNMIDEKFLEQMLNFNIINKQMILLSPGSTRKTLTIKGIKNIMIPVPPLVEQRGIAEVLSTVDEAILRTDAVIAKAEELKRGLMQRLLTRGIGHTEFKQTELGEIPETWQISTIEDVCYINRRSINPDKTPNKIIKYIDISSIENFQIKETSEFLCKDAPSRARRLVSKNDLIVSTVRPYLKAFANIEEKYNNYVCSTGFAVLTPININPDYLFQFIKSDKFVNTLKRYMVGSSYPAVTQNDIGRIKIPIPPITEQEKIASILSSIDDNISLCRKKKDKFTKIKKGLMQVLLTGKIRVRLDESGLHRIRDG